MNKIIQIVADDKDIFFALDSNGDIWCPERETVEIAPGHKINQLARWVPASIPEFPNKELKKPDVQA